MTTGQRSAVDQRLDQHADAFEIILDRLDALKRDSHIRLHRIERIEGRLHELERIVLPDPDKQESGRPSQSPT